MVEKWKKLDGLVECGNHYAVSNFGNVKNINRDSKLALIKDKDGYLTVGFSFKKKIKRYRVHRLVALAFIPNLENKPEVNHIDNVRSNNNVVNLEWSTKKENIHYAKKSGNMNGNKMKSFEKWQGNKNSSAVLDEKVIHDIVSDWNTGEYTFTSLSGKYNMSRSAISALINRKSWKHLNLNIEFTREKGTGIYDRNKMGATEVEGSTKEA